jgi:hypothetical protein
MVRTSIRDRCRGHLRTGRGCGKTALIMGAADGQAFLHRLALPGLLVTDGGATVAIGAWAA